jgi:hypothetical protein
MVSPRQGIEPSASGERYTVPAVAVILALWFAAVLGLGLGGIFESAPSQPPLPVLAAVVVPPALFALAYRASPGVRAFALGIDLRMLTAIQAWRVGGASFLALYAFGLLPGLFAWPAGAGDVAVGVAAVLVLRALLQQAPSARRSVFWLNVGGLVDFAGAITTGVLTSRSALGVFYDGVPQASLGAVPLSLVPTFLVPFWIMCHMISFLQLRR